MRGAMKRIALVWDTSGFIVLLSFAQYCLAADPIGFAWPKTDISITNTAMTRFQPLKNPGAYPLLVACESGYSIVCEAADGQRRAALLPLRDRFGNPLDIRRADDSITVSSAYPLGSLDSDFVVLKPGIILLQHGKRYSVLDKSERKLLLKFVFADLTQSVEVAEADVAFRSAAAETFRQGQLAKGLVEYDGRWMTPEEKKMAVQEKLFDAVQKGDSTGLEELLASGADVNGHTKAGVTPLHVAASSGNTNLIKLLIAKGADVNSRATDGSIPLHAAVASNRKEVVELLIQSGTRIYATDPDGRTPSELAVAMGREAIVEVLRTEEVRRLEQ